MKNNELAKQKKGERIARSFPREEFIIRKKDGTCISIKGKFANSSNSVLRTDDVDKIVESGDILERSLPNGVTEEYFVENVNYVKRKHLPNQYMISVTTVKQKGENMRGTSSTINNFYGDAKNIQIQQGTQNSTQSMSIEEEFDYKSASEIFNQILSNIDSFNLLDDDKNKLKEIAIEAQQFSEAKTNDTAISKTLLLVKDIMLRATGSLTASGILHLLSQAGV